MLDRLKSVQQIGMNIYVLSVSLNLLVVYHLDDICSKHLNGFIELPDVETLKYFLDQSRNIKSSMRLTFHFVSQCFLVRFEF